MMKMMAGMAIDRQNKYEEARKETHKYCCILDPSNSDNEAKRRTLAQLQPADLENLKTHHLDFL